MDLINRPPSLLREAGMDHGISGFKPRNSGFGEFGNISTHAGIKTTSEGGFGMLQGNSIASTATSGPNRFPVSGRPSPVVYSSTGGSNRTRSKRGKRNKEGDELLPGEYAQGPDGLSVTANIIPRPTPKAGELSNFGKIAKAQPMTFGPSSVFPGRNEGGAKYEFASLSRIDSGPNMFSMLSAGEDPSAVASAAAKSRPSSRETNVDFRQAGTPEAPIQRRKLQLLPRVRHVEETEPNAKCESTSLPSADSRPNMFSMLNDGDENSATIASAAVKSRPSGRETSGDFGQAGTPEVPVQREHLRQPIYGAIGTIQGRDSDSFHLLFD